MNKLTAIILAIYVACGAVTYGHAYVNGEKTIPGFDGKRREQDQIGRGAVAITAAALWPLYGSVVYWEGQQ